MGSENEHCWIEEEMGTGVGDEYVQQDAETFSRYQMKSHTFQATVTVRQIWSEGLSFQLWPAASAVCCYIENKFGDGGMRGPGLSVIDALPICQDDESRSDNAARSIFHCDKVHGDYAPPSVLHCDVARSDISSSVLVRDLALGDSLSSVQAKNLALGDSLSSVQERDLALGDSLSSVLERDLALGDSFSAGLESDLALVNRICSVIGRAAAVGDRFELNGRQIQNSSKAQVSECINSPLLAAGEISNQFDQTLTNYEPSSRQAKKSSETCEAKAVDDIETSFSGCTGVGKDHLSMKSMRVLELGSGTGMVGIVAACLGAHVVLTDLPHVIPNISYNLHLNKGAIDAAGGSVEAKVLRWGVEEDVKALGELSFDLILASDCVYHVTSYKPFLQTLQWLMTRELDRTNVSVEQRRPTIANGLHSDFSPQLLRLAVRSPPLTSILIPSKGTIVHEVNSKLNGKQIESPVELLAQSVSKSAQGRSNECVILLGHMRRWKKDATFFRMASKCFNVDVGYRHPPEENARIGAIVYLLSTKSKSKFSSRSLSLTSDRSSSNASSPGH